MDEKDILARLEALEKKVDAHDKLINELEASRPHYHPLILEKAEEIAQHMEQRGEAALKRLRKKGFAKPKNA